VTDSGQPAEPKTPPPSKYREAAFRIRALLPAVPVRIGAFAIAVGAGFVIYSVRSGALESDEAAVVSLVGLVAIVVVVAMLTPAKHIRPFLARVNKVTLGSLGIDLNPSDIATSGPAEETNDKDPDQADDLFDLKVRLESKLTYLAKHLLTTDASTGRPVATFLTIGSLTHDGYLDRKQATRAYQILGMREFEFRGLPVAEQKEFLTMGTVFTANVRAIVFSAYVVREINRLPGWTAKPEYTDTGSKRRDLRVVLGGFDSDAAAVVHHVVPVFTTVADSRLIRNIKSRIGQNPLQEGTGKRFIVVPPLSKARQSQEEAAANDIAVVTLHDLRKLLNAAATRLP
jgi:hypothetical protein